MKTERLYASVAPFITHLLTKTSFGAIAIRFTRTQAAILLSPSIRYAFVLEAHTLVAHCIDYALALYVLCYHVPMG